MTRIKMCGLTRSADIEAANELRPDYIGFVFVPESRRYICPEQAEILKKLLDPGIRAVGVFADENPEKIAALLEGGVIDIAQLHGSEDDAAVRELRRYTEKPVIRAFRVRTAADVQRAEEAYADAVLLDAGAGSGTVFDWNTLRDIRRPYFLAGGLTPENVGGAVRQLRPFAVDVSSGIETGTQKDRKKMAAFAAAVRDAELRKEEEDR